jgi:hypothetical protein
LLLNVATHAKKCPMLLLQQQHQQQQRNNNNNNNQQIVLIGFIDIMMLLGLWY